MRESQKASVPVLFPTQVTISAVAEGLTQASREAPGYLELRALGSSGSLVKGWFPVNLCWFVGLVSQLKFN